MTVSIREWCHEAFPVPEAVPGMALAAMPHGQAAGLQAVSAGSPDSPVKRRPLIEVRYVLVNAPQTQAGLPQIDMGHRASAIVPMSLMDYRSVLLRSHDTDPNQAVCRKACVF